MVYPPFATPATPPYSLAHLNSFLKKNLGKEHELYAMDLNIAFHKRRFQKFSQSFRSIEGFDRCAKDFLEEAKGVYSRNNKEVIRGGRPQFFDEMLGEMLEQRPDVVVFSIVYSSQAFYAYALMMELKKRGIRTVIGGPGKSEFLLRSADLATDDFEEVLLFIEPKFRRADAKDEDFIDFSIFDSENYFLLEPVLPIKTSHSCYYQKCAFCDHHGQKKYYELPLESVERTIKMSKAKNFFIIDDMIHKQRLLRIARMMEDNGARWMCQLRPTKDLDYETLRELSESGLKVVLWGVESGNDRVLSLMGKQTDKGDIARVLSDSKKAGILNVAYVIFGFPSETEAEFVETIDFLKANASNLDLVSSSVFGLQKGTQTYSEPERFFIDGISEKERTILDPMISYTTAKGMSQERAKELKRKYSKTLAKLNQYPQACDFFREQMLLSRKE